MKRSCHADVDLCRMPYWTMVVLGGPDFGGSVVFEQVDIEGHGSGWTEHMVPEPQADWTVIMARRAQQTGWIAIGCTVSLNVHVGTSCRNIGHFKINMENKGHLLLSHIENYLQWYGPGLGQLDLMGWVLNFLSNQNCPELAGAIHIGCLQSCSLWDRLWKSKFPQQNLTINTLFVHIIDWI